MQNDAINDTARTKRISSLRNNWRESKMKKQSKDTISDDTLDEIILVLNNYIPFMKVNGCFMPDWVKKVTKLRKQLVNIQTTRILKEDEK